MVLPGKLSRPRLQRVFARRRLFVRLDAARARPVIWIAAPPGAGKTTLVGSWLEARKLRALWYTLDEGDDDPASFFAQLSLAARDAVPSANTPAMPAHEYLGGLSAFARRWFSELWAGVQEPFALVLDNFQDLPPGSATQRAIRVALEEVPQGANAVVISRESPPPALARLQLNEALAVISPAELALSLDEAHGIAALRETNGAALVTIEQIQQRTGGWAAGLVLLLVRGAQPVHDSAREPAGTPQALFDYFAGEVFQRADSVTRTVLLETAPFAQITAAHAQMITGLAEAGKVLDDLARHAYFTTRHDDAFQYHPLFREFLLAEGQRSLPQDRLRQIRVCGARLFEESGELDLAADLFREAGRLHDVARIALEHAPALIATGRAATLAGWLRFIPEELVEAQPWLGFWRGMSTFPFNPLAGQRELERCYELFRGSGDPSALYTVWAAIVNTYVYLWNDLTPLDRWIDEWTALRRRYPLFPDVTVEARASFAILAALVYRQPQHAELQHWKERSLALVGFGSQLEQAALMIVVASHLCWSGHYRELAELLPAAAPSIEGATDLAAVLTWRMAVATARWFQLGEYPSVAVQVDDFISLARQHGARVWLYQMSAMGAQEACAVGELESAERYLQQARDAYDPSRALEAAFYSYAQSHLALRRGEFQESVRQAELSLDKARTAGAWFAELFNGVMLGVALCDAGEPERAREALEDVRRLGRRVGTGLADYLCSLTDARIACKLGRPELAIEPLRQAMRFGAAHGMLGTLGPDVTPELCAIALGHQIEIVHVRKLISARGLLPPDCALEEEQWPWHVRIRMLGRFELEVRDTPVRFRHKVQRRPLELLKALVAMGGTEVPDERLTDALWPDADGDAAGHALETTMYRLRKLLGCEQAVTQSAHRVSLDRRRCWVDAWAVARKLSRATSAFESRTQPLEGLLADAAQAVDAYSGAFLAEDETAPWVYPMREQLRMSVRRCLDALASAPDGRAFATRLSERCIARDSGLARRNVYATPDIREKDG